MPPRARTAKTAAPVETAPVVDLPIRTCVVCGQADDHPRCLVDDGTEADLNYHKDCHRNAFGDTYADPDGSVHPFTCHAVLAVADADLRGDALRVRIVEFNKNGA